ncbi:Thiamin-phosphate pyrophosphorylase [Arcticibacter svalbardensis MN12-7]|uniref:Thiamin-phosphate pyrophosphorylase n=1 Tax=Arcticibacter svalbardensis MN12-7 TaxID=1150600 RepID=R9GQT6_9SPHI|nr:thiamine phosphate synthase [Arcticibacter svalbardensis]EOR94172.1 Thiamin-phosphate pyrophosphorylase [Arcticibacter svalbardensis MN12-7]
MKLIVISNPTELAAEAKTINALFELGLKCFHLRKPHGDINKLRDFLKQINPMYYPRIALHQYHELATELGIKRLHFTEQARQDTGTEMLEMYREQGYILSTSIHELSIVKSLTHFEYAFYGPVFNSLSKPGYQGVLAENFKLEHSGSLKIIALGGITRLNITAIRDMNFDGAAFIGTIWNDPKHAIENFNSLINYFKQ